MTIGGQTRPYTVYRIPLSLLYYNDQNDRIATWITQYKNDPSAKSFDDLSKEDYNLVIQQFIVDSNPSAIEKTKNNIWEYSVGLGGSTSDKIAFKHPAVFPEQLAYDHIISS